MKRNKVFAFILTLIFCIGVFFIPAMASEGPERLLVNATWTEGEILHIEVSDQKTGEASSIELRPGDYSENAKTITIQVLDADGNKSGVIQVENPYYIEPAAEDGKSGGDEEPADSTPSSSESAVPGGLNPFTPDGTGGVVDNATEEDGKEFFTITTANENTFYLIVDRQKSGENVYLLNGVTENDLMALAESSGGKTSSGLPDLGEPEEQPAPEPEPEPKKESRSGTIIFIVLAAAIAGGAGYYFKIVKPKRQESDGADDFEYEDDQVPDDENDGMEETE